MKAARAYKSIVRQSFIAFMLIVSAFIIMTGGLVIIEKITIIDAFYMAMISFSTVGFGEVKPMSEHGRLFLSVMILYNILIYAYTIKTISSFLLDGELRNYIIIKRMEQKINKLEGHVIVCGFGRLGKRVCEELLQEGKAFVVIEKSEDAINQLNELKYNYIIDDATHEEVLVRANVKNAQSLITTIPEDAHNVYVVITGRQLNSSLKIISRFSQASSEAILKKAGANHLIMPETLSGIHMAALVTKPELVEFISVISGSGMNVFLEEMFISQFKNEYQKLKLVDLQLQKETGVHILGLKRPNEAIIINPDGDLESNKNDILILLGSKEQLHRFRQMYIA